MIKDDLLGIVEFLKKLQEPRPLQRFDIYYRTFETITIIYGIWQPDKHEITLARDYKKTDRRMWIRHRVQTLIGEEPVPIYMTTKNQRNTFDTVFDLWLESAISLDYPNDLVFRDIMLYY